MSPVRIHPNLLALTLSNRSTHSAFHGSADRGQRLLASPSRPDRNRHRLPA
jgi:hypothetical protein